MRASVLLCGAALALTSALALAQDGPESLLPKMFEDPAPAPSRAAPSRPASTPQRPAQTPPRSAQTPQRPAQNNAGPRPVQSAAATSATPQGATAPGGTPVIQSLPTLPAPLVAAAEGERGTLSRIPSLEELEKMTPEDFEALLGSRLIIDIPAAARRSPQQAGLLDESEGGLRADSLGGQSGSLIRLALSANRGALVSRWGHIVLRRALVSRLQPPVGMNPADFLALRVSLLLRMGEPEAARALLQDMDIAGYNPAVGAAVVDVYARTADFTGLCPVLSSHGSLRNDDAWSFARTICESFRGNSTAAISRLDRELSRGKLPKIDVLLAQKYAGAAGKSRRAVTIEWGDVKSLSTWRYGLALGVGLEPPASLVAAGGPAYDYTTALAPMASLVRRATAADRAATAGVLSNAALVDLYSQIYADPDVTGEWQDRAEALRDAYTQEDPAARVTAMEKLWSGAEGKHRFARQVLTASAAARMPPDASLVDAAPGLIASMLTAGYDANALRWSSVVESGTPGWALLVLAAPGRVNPVDGGALSNFVDGDESVNKRKSAFLVAGLAALERVGSGEVNSYSGDLGLNLDSDTRYTRAIQAAAERGDAASVVLLAGFGMQGGDWQRMTPRYLFHIVSSLRRVGLDAEARMIAAEAVSRA